jgi:hypothetical protein
MVYRLKRLVVDRHFQAKFISLKGRYQLNGWIGQPVREGRMLVA